jgi:hypothetical protein
LTAAIRISAGHRPFKNRGISFLGIFFRISTEHSQAFPGLHRRGVFFPFERSVVLGAGRGFFTAETRLQGKAQVPKTQPESKDKTISKQARLTGLGRVFMGLKSTVFPDVESRPKIAPPGGILFPDRRKKQIIQNFSTLSIV